MTTTWSRVKDSGEVAYRIVTRGVPIVAILTILVLLAVELRRDLVIVLPVEVAPRFVELGYTPDAVTELLLDHANRIR